LIGNIAVNGSGACTSVAPTAILPPMAVSTFPVHQVANGQPTIFDSSLIPQYSGKLNSKNLVVLVYRKKLLSQGFIDENQNVQLSDRC
jgi:hypothetical protein